MKSQIVTVLTALCLLSITTSAVFGMSKKAESTLQDITNKLELVVNSENTAEQRKIYDEIKSAYGKSARKALLYLQKSEKRELRRRAFEVYYYILEKNESVIKKAMNDEYYVIRITALIWLGYTKDSEFLKYKEKLALKTDKKIFEEIIVNLEKRREKFRNPMFYNLYLQLEGEYLSLWGGKIIPDIIIILKDPNIKKEVKINLVRIIESYFEQKTFLSLQEKFEQLCLDGKIDKKVKEEIQLKINRIKYYKRKQKK